MESSGAELKKIRLEKGLSLEEVQKRTKIHLNILKALEEDSIINLNPVYIKGFLKIYCKFLGVDPKDYIPGYQEPRTIIQIASDREDAQAGRFSFLKTASVRLSQFRNINIKTVFTAIFILGLFIVLFALGKSISLRRASLAKEKRSAALLSNKTDKRKTQAARLQNTQSPQAAPAHKEQRSVEAAPKNKEVAPGIRLGIRTRDDCWVSLKVDGRVVNQGILKKGRFESWQAEDKIELSLGNAGVVDLEVNGKLISNLGRKGQALKNILITREGLIIPR